MLPTILQSILQKVERPARYLGGEINSSVKDLSKVSFKVALVMPETYEIAQSNTGLKILYEILNLIPHVACERVYAPWVDFEKELRAHKIKPFSLENKIPLSDFDLIGISLPYELSYTNILTLFDLAHLPFYAKDRTEQHPLILGGGNQAFNPEPVAEFFDAFVVGDGEEALVQIVEKCDEHKKAGLASSKKELLKKLSSITGVYIPEFFNIHYHEDGRVKNIEAEFEDYQGVKKATVSNLDLAAFPTKPVVPSVKTVHDRLAVEVQRGCVRACRFCQAGYIYRPERQRSPEKVLKIIEESLQNTGDDQISLLSLSIGDYGCLIPLVRQILKQYEKQKISLSLPATRTDTYSEEVVQEIKKVRKTGITLAPEAGSPRMRRVINKGNSREDLFQSVENIFLNGWQLIKFYYMCGLPFEGGEDLISLAQEAEGALKIGKKYDSQAQINLNLSPFVPKPHTPFQWEAQDSIEKTYEKIRLIKSQIKMRGVTFKHHSPEESFLEGIFARGDRRLSQVIIKAWEKGSRFDGWKEMLKMDVWMQSMQECGLDPNFYVTRSRSKDEVLPWDHLFIDLKKEFLIKECEAAKQEAFIEDCSTHKCSDCGICDYKTILNRNYQFKQNSNDQNSLQLLEFSTRYRRLGEKEASKIFLKQIQQPIKNLEEPKTLETREESLPPSLSKVYTLRCKYQKTGPAAYLSHLELMGLLRRAISRAKMPVCFSQGFHPQPKLSLSQALALGLESVAEYFDIQLSSFIEPKYFIESLNPILPEGLKLLEAHSIEASVSLSASMKGWVWEINFDEGFPGGEHYLNERVSWLKNQKELLSLRSKKRKSESIDILPYLGKIQLKNHKVMSLETFVINEKSARPKEVLAHLLKERNECAPMVHIRKVDSLFISHEK